jgi:hypothetical protein
VPLPLRRLRGLVHGLVPGSQMKEKGYCFWKKWEQFRWYESSSLAEITDIAPDPSALYRLVSG